MLLIIAGILLVPDQQQTPVATGSYSHEPESGSIEVSELSAEISDTSVRRDVIGNIYIYGLLHNTSDTAVRKTRIEAELLNSEKKKIAAGFGYTYHRIVRPEEKSPFKILIKSAPDYADYRLNYELELPYVQKDRVPMKISDIETRPENFSRYLVKGRITNTGGRTATFSSIALVLTGQDKKIKRMKTSYIPQKKIKPGEYSLFTVNLYGMKNEPADYLIFYDNSPAAEQ